MKPFTTTSHLGLARLAAPLGLAAVLLTLALGLRSFAAGGGEPQLPGGGDAIGSLPFNVGGPGASAPSTPSLVLEANSLEAIESVVVDAFGDGYAQYFVDAQTGLVRVELQGKVTLILDRNRIATAGVRTLLDVTQGFSGGLGVLIKNGKILATQGLPAVGDLPLPMNELGTSGVLDHGTMTLRSINQAQQQHNLDLSGSGGTLRLTTRD